MWILNNNNNNNNRGKNINVPLHKKYLKKYPLFYSLSVKFEHKVFSFKEFGCALWLPPSLNWGRHFHNSRPSGSLPMLGEYQTFEHTYWYRCLYFFKFFLKK
jgi:hypothetical protein